MSAILSADDLNDFISPGVACIKPIETLPAQAEDNANAYEVTTEDKVTASNPPPAQISLTDCLACSGCVTSAEAVLVSLQSHTEVLNTLDAYPSIARPWLSHNGTNGITNGHRIEFNAHHGSREGKLFVASVSPQTRASLAATFGVSEIEAGNMISQLLSGASGLKTGGAYGSHFTWVIDTNTLREACLVAAADEVLSASSPEAQAETPSSTDEASFSASPKRPILTSACPGWICYAEKTHPYVLPHLSRLKSPQALTGTLLKSVLSQQYNVPPSQIWHLAVMPCFDKKLEASRGELTSSAWLPPNQSSAETPIRDVDCVITARELLHLAAARNISFSSLPRTPLPSRDHVPFPDARLDSFLFSASRRANQDPVAGSSGGYLYHNLCTYQSLYPGSSISVTRGRNADVVEYSLVHSGQVVVKMARFYGFRNIQNLVRRLKPAKISRMPGARVGTSRRPGAAASVTGAGEGGKEYAYVEVMACPGGCSNGGGQVKVSEVANVRAQEGLDADEETTSIKPGPKEQKEWLAKVDEAYYSASESELEENNEQGKKDADGDQVMEDAGAPPAMTNGFSQHDQINGISKSHIRGVLEHWSKITNVDTEKLLYTSFRKVESDVGKKKTSDVERVAGLASTIGGGW